jgi:hypothetical protein
MNVKKRTLVMVSTVIDGKRRTKFAHATPDSDGKFRIELSELPGVKDLPRGKVIGIGA